MWKTGWRDEVLTGIEQPWDIVVVGGGVVGAGIFLHATRAGLKVLLLEAKDFAFGASSRSTKLINGDFQSTLNKQFNITRVSVREREWLMRQAGGLVTELEFLLPYYKHFDRPKRQFDQGVIAYDLLATKWKHQHLSLQELSERNSWLRKSELEGGYQYFDAQVDDARLVLRLLEEGMDWGGTAINYAPVNKLLRTRDGRVCGTIFSDKSFPKGSEYAVQAKIIINATGAWGDDLREHIGDSKKVSNHRGSHLVFSGNMLQIQQAVTLFHPSDNRLMFACPWEGNTLVGTTDVTDLSRRKTHQDEPCVTEQEINYILEMIQFAFPSLGLSQADILATFSGLWSSSVSNGIHPRNNAQGFQILEEEGLLTIIGGRLTTFRVVAKEIMRQVNLLLQQKLRIIPHSYLFKPTTKIPTTQLDDQSLNYLSGRYGDHLPNLIMASLPQELTPITANLHTVWGELRWAARSEAVIHLEDLLLRRVRLGLLLPNGGLDIIDKIQPIVQPELGWNDAKWKLEVNTYRNIWNRSYSPEPLG